MWAVGRNEVELNPTFRSRQPGLDQFRVMVSGIVQKDVDQPHAGYIASTAINSMMVLKASTVSTSLMMV